MKAITITILKFLITIAMVVGAGAAAALWPLSEETAQEYPEFAYLQWPYLAICELLLASFFTLLVAIWALLNRVRRNSIFDASAMRWVNLIVGCGVFATVLLVMALIPVAVITHGPPGLSILLITGITAALGFTLLMTVMRQLLRQATGLRTELDEVI